MILFADEDELRGTKCLNSSEDLFEDSQIELVTFGCLFMELSKFDKQDRINHYDFSKETGAVKNPFSKLQEQGVKVFSFFNNAFPTSISDYYKDFAEKNSNYKKIYPLKCGEFWPQDTEMGQGFFGELLLEGSYRDGSAQQSILQGHKNHLPDTDYSSEYYNVLNGRRKTCFKPTDYVGKIYFFGECIVMGAYVEDKYTIESWLQKRLCEEGFSYCVENCGSYDSIFDAMQKVVYHKGDIIIFWTGTEPIPGLEAVDLRRVYEKYQIPAEWALESLGHHNHKVTKIISDEIYQMIKPSLTDKKVQPIAGQTDSIKFQVPSYHSMLGIYIQKTYLERWFTPDFLSECETVGCIVTDLNTYPLYYKNVIMEAKQYVKSLIVFVPAEGVGYKFTSMRYIHMLLGIIKGLKNITIVPGERYVPYFNYVRSYYEGEKIKEKQAKIDAAIFAECIAEPLHITYRFALKENANEKIVDYNKILKETLPMLGVKFMEISV
ncbi:MAG: hypothetical protein NC400_12165 [Clostridium sp.]|nr:hypothetical protein [Clostridium sp.]